MPDMSLDPMVIFIACVALSITVLSIYVSRVYLPMKIKDAYLKSITALAAAVETKDSGTVGHAQRVARLTVEVAQRLGVDCRELEVIQYAALLRDIGKARVPHAILNKSGHLTQEEWEIVQSHAMLGAEMVSNVPFLQSAAKHVLHHHEYWDGSGYPDGLKGEEIPLGSRILAVASDYDAMVSERPYHPQPMDAESAMEEIRRGAGAKYDPAVVEVFLEVLAVEIASTDGRSRAA